MPSHFLNIFGAWLVIGQGDAWNHWVSWICLGGAIFFATSTWPSAVLKLLFFSVFFRCSRGFSREWLFLFCCQAICIISLEECNSMRLSSWLQHLGFNGLTDWLFVWHATVKHGETWGVHGCQHHHQQPGPCKTPLNLTDISISEVAFEIMRSLCHCGTWRDGWCPMVEASRLYLLHSDDDCSCLRVWSEESWGSHVEETLLFTLVGPRSEWPYWPLERRSEKEICMDLFGFVDRLHGNPLRFVRTWKLVMWRSVLVVFWQRRVSPSQNRPLQDDPLRRLSVNTCEYLWIFLSYLWSRNQGPLQSSHNTSVQMRVIRLRKHHTPSLISRKFNIFVHQFPVPVPWWQVQWRDLTFQFDAGKRWLQNHRSDLVV